MWKNLLRKPTLPEFSWNRSNEIAALTKPARKIGFPIDLKILTAWTPILLSDCENHCHPLDHPEPKHSLSRSPQWCSLPDRMLPVVYWYEETQVIPSSWYSPLAGWHCCAPIIVSQPTNPGHSNWWGVPSELGQCSDQKSSGCRYDVWVDSPEHSCTRNDKVNRDVGEIGWAHRFAT